MADLHGLVIHLERATARAGQVARLIGALPFPGEVLPAVDARAPGGLPAGHDPALSLEPRYPFPLTDVEVAIFHSHRRAWSRIVEAGWDGALILEDDATLDPEAFPAALEIAREAFAPDRFIRLPIKDREAGGEVVAERGGLRVVRPAVIALNLQAQLVGREAAERLLAASARFDRPVDTWLQMRWVHGVDILSVWPTGVGEASGDLGGSTQKKRRGTLARISAEIARSRYRRRIAALSRR